MLFEVTWVTIPEQEDLDPKYHSTGPLELEAATYAFRVLRDHGNDNVRNIMLRSVLNLLRMADFRRSLKDDPPIALARAITEDYPEAEKRGQAL